MPSLLIAYATREGHTRRVAEYLRQHLSRRSETLSVALCDCNRAESLDLKCYEAVILTASVHNRRHEPEAIQFGRHMAAADSGCHTAFISVSSVQMLVESPRTSARLRTLAERGARELIEQFVRDTGLHPTATFSVSGALMYTQYRLLLRFALSLFARLGGLSTDTARDHVYTDWRALERFADGFVAELEAHSESVSPSKL